MRFAAILLAVLLSVPSWGQEEESTGNALVGATMDEVRCVMPIRIRETEILGDRHIVFHMKGNGMYLVEFARPCQGLSRNSSFRIEVKGSGYCKFDTIQPLSLAGRGSGFWGPRCAIPGFKPITESQVDALKGVLEEG